MNLHIRSVSLVSLFAIVLCNPVGAQDARDADFDGNGRIGAGDLLIFIENRNPPGNPAPSATAIQMITLPTGTFQMGNSGVGRDLQFGNVLEQPRHAVAIGYNLQIGIYEVTNSVYAAVLNWASGQGILTGPIAAVVQPNHPVTRVSWFGALSFCNWASQRDGYIPCYDLTTRSLIDPYSGGYRLPSESEWEYACRGGRNRIPTGMSLSRSVTIPGFH